MWTIRTNRERRGLSWFALLSTIVLAMFIATTIGAPVAGAYESDDRDEYSTTSFDITASVSEWDDADRVVAEMGSANDMRSVRQQVKANYLWRQGYRGRGVDVALIDSGVVPVDSLDRDGMVVNGPDLSLEAPFEEVRYLDTYGHGTHLAGIIAGKSQEYKGIAPQSRILNVKVAASDGAVDVTQVIAAIDWVVQHRTDNGMNVRVINLSYGTTSALGADADALSHAVEQAWHAGIVVVVAAGNDGPGAEVRSPATNPYVITVGAADGSQIDSRKDAAIAAFSSCGIERTVDIVAPGRSILSARNPGSMADVMHPEARVDQELFVGSGTSQAAAVVSGSIALLLEARPELTPDQVKYALTASATYLHNAPEECQGHGLINLRAAVNTNVSDKKQSHNRSRGNGPIDAVRGKNKLTLRGVVLEGEQDIFGKKFDTGLWAQLAAKGSSWDGGVWNGTLWTGDDWSGDSWAGAAWEAIDWTVSTWAGGSWSGGSWSGGSWSGGSWSGGSWSGGSWSGGSWSGDAWQSFGGWR